MKARLENELFIIIIVSSFLTIVIALVTSTVPRIILGLPFLLFFPGYTLVAALFPRSSDLEGIERVALSFGLSIAVVPLTVLFLNYTPWGIKLYPILISLAIFILVMSFTAWYRRTRFPYEERFDVSFRLRLPSWQDQSRVDKVLYLGLAVAMLGAIGILGWFIASPQDEEKFTEFYILDQEGGVRFYPLEFTMEGDRVFLVNYGGDHVFTEEYGKVIIGIVNHEGEKASYHVKVKINGENVNLWQNELWVEETEAIVLPDKVEKEQVIGFAPQEISGSTTLSSPVTQGQKKLVIAGTDNFKANDYIQIGATEENTAEFVQIEDIDTTKSEITIKTELKYDHNEGDTVIEKQKVEFLLYKDGEIYFEDRELPHLWINVKEVS